MTHTPAIAYFIPALLPFFFLEDPARARNDVAPLAPAPACGGGVADCCRVWPIESRVFPGTGGTSGLCWTGFGASCWLGTDSSVWQLGQLIWWPIHNSSQAISCPHFEQLNFNSAIHD